MVVSNEEDENEERRELGAADELILCHWRGRQDLMALHLLNAREA